MTSALATIDILWITAGLGCDGDSIAMTAATQPSLEDLVMGAIPGIPKINFHHPVLAYEVGEEFLKVFYDAAEDRLDPFNWRLRQRRWHLHWLHHAGLSGQIHAVHEPATGVDPVVEHGFDLRQKHQGAAKVYSVVVK